MTPDIPLPPWELSAEASRLTLQDADTSSRKWLSATGDWEKMPPEQAARMLPGRHLELDLTPLMEARTHTAPPSEEPWRPERQSPRFDNLERRSDPPSRWPTEPVMPVDGEKVYVFAPGPDASRPQSPLPAMARSVAAAWNGMEWAEPPPPLTSLADRRFTNLDRQAGFSRIHLASHSEALALKRRRLASSRLFWNAVLRAAVLLVAALLIRRWLF